MPAELIEIPGHRIEVQTGKNFREKSQPFFWPLVGDYPIYDRYIYAVMTADGERSDAYRKAIGGLADGRTVVEIGTGDQAHWARSCANSGAKTVYAIEKNRTALEQASRLISEEGLSEVILLLDGDSTEIELPEKADLSVSELIGEIGGSEGAAAILNDVRRRLLKPGARSVPWKCVTYCSPVELPVQLQEAPLIERMGLPYVRKIFELAGHPFDIRLSVDNCFDSLREGMLSRPVILEEMDFDDFCEESWTREIAFEVTKAGTLSGMLLWIELFTGHSSGPLSSLKEGSNWRPVFCPLFEPALRISPGDTVDVIWKTTVPNGHTHPDYEISCSVSRSGRKCGKSHLFWPHLGSSASFRQNAFYERLFSQV